eukprot:Lithocolla_globosa_v1_NODE_2218_length_2105_cov_2.588780.p3 type:complete len:124 gc:universal NODE_2218_length_2105_cov_2.588780:944-573(-)
MTGTHDCSVIVSVLESSLSTATILTHLSKHGFGIRRGIQIRSTEWKTLGQNQICDFVNPKKKSRTAELLRHDLLDNRVNKYKLRPESLSESTLEILNFGGRERFLAKLSLSLLWSSSNSLYRR